MSRQWTSPALFVDPAVEQSAHRALLELTGERRSLLNRDRGEASRSQRRRSRRFERLLAPPQTP